MTPKQMDTQMRDHTIERPDGGHGKDCDFDFEG